MKRVETPSYVLEAIERTKTGATGFRTNLFPDSRKLQCWIAQGQLQAEVHNGCALFFRTDRDFCHMYFCASDGCALARGLEISDTLRSMPVVIDVLQNQGDGANMAQILGQAGFRPYQRLQRMTRTSCGTAADQPAASGLGEAIPEDVPRIVELLEGSFDRHANQLPMAGEVASAIAKRQILTSKTGGGLAALLFYETQGLTSTIRFWLAAEAFRGQRHGAALIRHYLGSQPQVRRFTLWVVTENTPAIRKYEHYGYSPDGLVDQVFVNTLITS